MTRAAPRLLVASVCLLSAACGSFLCPPDELHPKTPPPRISEAPPGPLEAGAAMVDITPKKQVFIAGFGFYKPSKGVHDPITVRALALRRGSLVAVVVGSDLIGLHNYQVEAVRDRLAKRANRDAILISATHTHAGPDTLGMWGVPPIISGLDEDYVERVLSGITRAAEQAIDRLTPVTARWGQAQAPQQGISKNRRDPDLIDRTVTALAFDALDGTPVATLVHFACHPEVLGSKNELLSADFPGPLYRAVEAGRKGGVAIYLNGALGGMVTADEAAHTFEEVERIGAAVGKLALQALRPGKPLPKQMALRCSRRPIYMPIQLRAMHLGDLFGIFGRRPFLDGGYTPSEVMALRVGPVVLLTAPGEVLPRLGFELVGLIASRPGLLVGLGNDELGYILHEGDWKQEQKYRYEKTVSPGPLAAVLIRKTARAALKDVGALKQDAGD